MCASTVRPARCSRGLIDTVLAIFISPLAVLLKTGCDCAYRATSGQAEPCSQLLDQRVVLEALARLISVDLALFILGWIVRERPA